MQRDEAERRAFAAKQFDLDVIDEEFLARVLANPGKFITAPVVTRLVIDVLYQGVFRAPD
ncbi:hypothetical protein D3C81_2326810 [compost metagenome]